MAQNKSLRVEPLGGSALVIPRFYALIGMAIFTSTVLSQPSSVGRKHRTMERHSPVNPDLAALPEH